MQNLTNIYQQTDGSIQIKLPSSENYVEIKKDGTIVVHGDATCWDDLANGLINKKLYSTAGKIDYDFDENSIKFQPGGDITNKNDRVAWNEQKLHRIKATSKLQFHIHLEQTSTDKIIFTLKYRIQENGKAKNTTWTTITCNTEDDGLYTYSSGTLNQIIVFPEIDISSTGLSDLIQCQLARTDSTSSDVYVTFVDAHVEIDTFGSYTQWSK